MHMAAYYINRAMQKSENPRQTQCLTRVIVSLGDQHTRYADLMSAELASENCHICPTMM